MGATLSVHNEDYEKALIKFKQAISPWQNQPDLQRFIPQTDHAGHRWKYHALNLYQLNEKNSIIIAHGNIILFNTMKQSYHFLGPIPFYTAHDDLHLNSINVTKARNDDKYHFIVFMQNKELQMYELIIDYQGIENINKVNIKWIDIKSSFMDKDFDIIIHRTSLVSDIYNPHLIYLFSYECHGVKLSVFDLKLNEMKTNIFGIGGHQFLTVISLNNSEFIHFNFDQTVQYITYDMDSNKISLKEEIVPLYISQDHYEPGFVRFSNYIIKFRRKNSNDNTQSTWLSIYDWVNNKWYESKTEHDAFYVDFCIMSQSAFIYGIGYEDQFILRHSRLNIKQILDVLCLFYWSDKANECKVLFVIDYWFRNMDIKIIFAQNLSFMIMNYVCAPR